MKSSFIVSESGLRTLYKSVIPVLISASGILSMFLVAYSLNHDLIPLLIISKYSIVNFTFTLQLLVLPVSFIALMLIYFYDKAAFNTFFRFSIFRKNPESQRQISWSLGPVLSVVFTFGTIIYMSFAVASQNGSINEKFLELLPLVILFAITNAWTEEIFSRFVIVAGLYGRINPVFICWISAILFGLPHYFGTPNGILGVLMSGLLGWFLAKSIVETRSLGWALFIHFLQDLIIFGAGAMIIAGQS